jgi:soluble lytic murein transglycosylase-like protein
MVVRVTRVADREETVAEPSPYAVRLVADPELDRGRQVVLTPGQPGLIENTYRVRIVDGQEVERTLLSSVEIAPPQDEVRRVGTRLPSAPAAIEAIIRQAAAANGADADQLLRIAWCESRYDPNAYNPTSGASGLFQFVPPTWATNSVRAGYAGASPFDAEASANVAAWMFARGSANLWACK